MTDLFFKTGDSDFTNNTVEVINSRFKELSSSGFKTYANIVETIYEFMADSMNLRQEMLASQLNRQKKSTWLKIDARNEITLEFHNFTHKKQKASSTGSKIFFTKSIIIILKSI